MTDGIINDMEQTRDAIVNVTMMHCFLFLLLSPPLKEGENVSNLFVCLFVCLPVDKITSTQKVVDRFS